MLRSGTDFPRRNIVFLSDFATILRRMDRRVAQRIDARAHSPLSSLSQDHGPDENEPAMRRDMAQQKTKPGPEDDPRDVAR